MILALWQYIKKNPVHYVIAGVLAIISSLLYLITNYIIQLFVDGIVENNLIKEDMMRYFMIFGITMIFIYLTEATWVILTFGQ